ncbi:M50 family metallopeptidase [Lapillicoccus sp.]|uniref:M50 family metallopeptidase n=1 Tax=Lapillicoccus sp. TaxID=1909287 RepID=UPI003983787C
MIAYIAGVLFVVVGVGLSIALHEIGHLVPAKRFGVKVTQYMVGFGPTIWSRRRGETEYGLKAIPLGGYIRMIGMFPPKPGDAPDRLRSSSTGRFSQLMDQARQESMEEVGPADRDRVFYRLSVPRKVAVMLGGPLMNFAIAAILLGGISTLYGIATVTPLVAKVATCAPLTAPSVQVPQPECKTGDPTSPASVAGLQEKDRIISINGRAVTTWDEVTPLIRNAKGTTMAMVVERGGQQVTLQAPIASLNRASYVDTDKVKVDATGAIVTEPVGYLGATPTVENVKGSIGGTPAFVGNAFVQTASVVVHVPQKMVGIFQAAFGSGERDRNGPISVVGVGRVGGEIASADLGAGSTGAKFVTLISLVASLNMALFVFNLIPLLPLDGGHVAGALWEGLKRRSAKLLGKADPGHVDVAKALPVAYTMAVILIGMSALLIYADIVKPVKFFN